MPKTIIVSSGAHKDLNFIGHENAEEFDREAGYTGACAEEGDTSIAYRSTLPEFHKTFTPIAEEMTKIKRGVNAEATAKAKARAKDGSKVDDVLESYITYSNRVKAQLSAEDWAAFDAAAHEHSAKMRIDASPSKRQAGPGKDLLTKADSLLQLPQDQLNAKIAKYQEAAPDFELVSDETGKPDRASLARLVGKYLDWALMQV